MTDSANLFLWKRACRILWSQLSTHILNCKNAAHLHLGWYKEKHWESSGFLGHTAGRIW